MSTWATILTIDDSKSGPLLVLREPVHVLAPAECLVARGATKPRQVADVLDAPRHASLTARGAGYHLIQKEDMLWLACKQSPSPTGVHRRSPTSKVSVGPTSWPKTASVITARSPPGTPMTCMPASAGCSGST